MCCFAFAVFLFVCIRVIPVLIAVTRQPDHNGAWGLLWHGMRTSCLKHSETNKRCNPAVALTPALTEKKEKKRTLGLPSPITPAGPASVLSAGHVHTLSAKRQHTGGFSMPLLPLFLRCSCCSCPSAPPLPVHAPLQGLRPFLRLSSASLEALRYRGEDVARTITKGTVREARARELQRELLNSDKLTEYFEEHEAERVRGWVVGEVC